MWRAKTACSGTSFVPFGSKNSAWIDLPETCSPTLLAEYYTYVVLTILSVIYCYFWTCEAEFCILMYIHAYLLLFLRVKWGFSLKAVLWAMLRVNWVNLWNFKSFFKSENNFWKVYKSCCCKLFQKYLIDTWKCKKWEGFICRIF